MSQQQVPALSPREWQLVRLVAEGCTNGEIAGKVGNTEQTVKSQLKLLMAKLDCRNRVDIVVAAHQLGLIDVGTLPRPTRTQHDDPDKLPPLSGDEAKVLAGAVNGDNAREIAEQMGVSIRLVFDARRRIYEKWQVDNPKDLVRLGKNYLATLTDKEASRG